MAAPAIATASGALSAPDDRSGQVGRLRETAQEFEALFLAQMLATLNQDLGRGLTGESGQAEIYQDMFNQEVARLISRTGGIGVADAILREMLKMQEVA